MSLQLRLFGGGQSTDGKLSASTMAATRSTNQKFWQALTKALSRR
jgi:hypothetical protein